MTERYYSNPVMLQKSANILRKMKACSTPVSLPLPDTLQPIIQREAFYCRTSEDEMLDKIVLYGTAVLSLFDEGASLGFKVATPATGGKRPISREIPFVYPMPGNTDETRAVIARIWKGAITELEMTLDGPTSEMLMAQCGSSGLSPRDNFVALAGLINFIGTSEREGLMFSVRPIAH